MDKKSKIIIFLFVVLIIFSIYLLYERVFIKQDFELVDSSIELQDGDNLE